MDKYEYKIRAEEIRNLIAREEYLEAAKIADTIDWTCVKKVGTLCTISDLYKKVRRYEDAIELLKLADQRNPEGKDITYSLCELYIKTGDVIHAVESYKAFVRIGARDPRRYVLQYKLIVAQDVSLEERIEVLEELKKRDYREKWAYELAYLYHRIGLGTKCVEECDELILWFGEGRYVYKAMELKMLHQPLTPTQQRKYDNRFRMDLEEEEEEAEETELSEEKEALPEVTKAEEAAALALGETREFHAVTEEDLMNLQVHTNVGEYNTMDLQRAIAEGVQEVLEGGDETAKEAVTRSILAPMYDTRVMEDPVEAQTAVKPEEPQVEVFFGETGELPADQETEEKAGEPAVTEERTEEVASVEEQIEAEERVPESAEEQKAREEEQSAKEDEDTRASREALQNTQKVGDVREITGRIIYPADMWVDPVPAQDDGKGTTTVFPSKLQEEALTAKPPEEIADSLTQEADGQISLVMPEDQKIAKQITGQLSIADVMLEWERMKKENEERNREQRYQEVKEQTGKMFNDFEAAVMDSVLEKLEREADLEQAAREADGISPEDEVEEIEEIRETEEETAGEEAEETFEEELEEEELEAEELEEEEALEEEELEADALEEETLEEEEFAEELEVAEAEEEPVEEEAEDSEPVAEESESEELELEEHASEEAEAELAVAAALTEGAALEEALEKELEEALNEETPEEAEADETAEEVTEEIAGETESEDRPIGPTMGIRALTKEEKELFGPFIQSREAREELARLLDTISLASYTGNVVLSGDDGTDLVGLATQIMKEIKQSDSNFSGKVAKITGKGLNEKKIEDVMEQLRNGGLIIESASELNRDTVKNLTNYLESENRGVIVVLADIRRSMDRFLREHSDLAEMFNARMHVKALSNDKLVAFARQYALELEYAIDEMGVLALHTRIEDRQTNGHAVTVMEAKEIVDRAIRHSRRKTPGHFFDVLTGKRYDEEDRIILEEKDFQ